MGNLNVREALLVGSVADNGYGGKRVLAKLNENVVENAIITVDGVEMRVQRVFTKNQKNEPLIALKDWKNGVKAGEQIMQITAVPTKHTATVISKPDVTGEADVQCEEATATTF